VFQASRCIFRQRRCELQLLLGFQASSRETSLSPQQCTLFLFSNTANVIHPEHHRSFFIYRYDPFLTLFKTSLAALRELMIRSKYAPADICQLSWLSFELNPVFWPNKNTNERESSIDRLWRFLSTVIHSLHIFSSPGFDLSFWSWHYLRYPKLLGPGPGLLYEGVDRPCVDIVPRAMTTNSAFW
jgi:hypothetical protein